MVPPPSEPAEMWFGSVLLLIIVAVIVGAAFCWRADGRMNFLIALMGEYPAVDLGEGSGDLRPWLQPDWDTIASRHIL